MSSIKSEKPSCCVNDNKQGSMCLQLIISLRPFRLRWQVRWKKIRRAAGGASLYHELCRENVEA
jgi:hypothetical protein